jgi:hypothetical protein
MMQSVSASGEPQAVSLTSKSESGKFVSAKHHSVHRILNSMVMMLVGHYGMNEYTSNVTGYGGFSITAVKIPNIKLCSNHLFCTSPSVPFLRIHLVITSTELELEENNPTGNDDFEWLDMNELWSYQGNSFSIYRLNREGSIRLTRSDIFPMLSSDKIVEFIAKTDETTNDLDEYFCMGDFLLWLKQQDPRFSAVELLTTPLAGISLCLNQGLQKIDDYFRLK